MYKEIYIYIEIYPPFWRELDVMMSSSADDSQQKNHVRRNPRIPELRGRTTDWLKSDWQWVPGLVNIQKNDGT